MRPLNVLWAIDHVCYDGSLHGGGRLYRHLLPEFDPERVRVHPYFLRAADAVVKEFATAPVPVTNLDRGRMDPGTALALWRLCREHRVDVMHLFCYASSTFGRLVSLATGVPTVIHDFDTQTYFPYPVYLRIADRVLARSTHHALAASPMCREYMHRTRGIPRDRIEVLPHAIPHRRFEAAARLDRAAARTALGWRPHHVVFTTVTKLGPDRGNEYLLRAFARVLAARPQARLGLVYKPTYYHRVPREYQHLEDLHDTKLMREGLDRLIAQLGIGHAVTVTESFDQPDEYYAAGDALVVPFLHERFSSVPVLEGMAHGMATIATRLGEQAELIEDGVHGLLVAPGDEAALAGAMIRLADQPAERARLGAGARALARQCSVTAAARRLTELYTRLARQPVARTELAAAGT